MIQGLSTPLNPAQPTRMMPSGNDVLDEIRAAHGNLSPAAQRAIALSGVAPKVDNAVFYPKPNAPLPTIENGGLSDGVYRPNSIGSGDPIQLLATSAPNNSSEIAAPIVGKAAAKPLPEMPTPPEISAPAAPRVDLTPILPAPSMLGVARPTTPADSHLAELNRLTAVPLPGGDPRAHTKEDTGRSGIGQIHNPWVRKPLQVLDALGATFFPRLEMMIPGTEGHHGLLVAGNRAKVNDDVKRAGEATSQRQTEAQTDEAQARAESLRHPKPSNAFELFIQQNPNATADDWFAEQEKNKTATTEFEAWAKDPANKGKPVSEYLKMKADNSIPKESELPLGERVPQLNAALTSRYQVLHPNQPLPPQFTLPTNATSKDFDRIDKLLQATETATSTKAQQDQLAEMRRQTQAIAAQNRKETRDVQVQSAAFKVYVPALDSAERFNVMAKNYEDAVKSNDQQAMLSLLANHLGMTMGLQKGSRITKDIINEAAKSRPWLQGIKAKFSGDGYLSGLTLSPEQMRQMVTLGRERFAEDLVKARNEARYLGSNDDGPKRTPNQATMRFYLGLANGDVTRAKQIAAEDGWTVE